MVHGLQDILKTFFLGFVSVTKKIVPPFLFSFYYYYLFDFILSSSGKHSDKDHIHKVVVHKSLTGYS